MAKTNLEKPHLTLAQDIMSSILVVIESGRTFRDAVELLTTNKLTVLPVVNKKGKLLGLISERDILKYCKSFDGSQPNFLDQKIHYKKTTRTVQMTTPIDQVGALLTHGSSRHIPVLDGDGKLRGIITRRDLIRVIYLRLELSGDNAKEIRA